MAILPISLPNFCEAFKMRSLLQPFMADAFEIAWNLMKQDFNDPRAADAMAMFQQVQAAKLARQQQMMNGGLNPMTGAAQPQQAMPAQQPAPQAMQQQLPKTCPTCSGRGSI